MKRWFYRIFLGLALLILAAAALLAIVVETGLASRWARVLIVRQIEKSTGARVQIGAVHLALRNLRAELDNFTLHGREAPGLPPLFHAQRIVVEARIASLLGRKITLAELEIDQPSLFLRIGENGQSNVPMPRVRGPRRPWREQLFNLEIARLKLSDGALEFNDARIPLDAEGRDFQFAMTYEAQAKGGRMYVGQLRWRGMEFAARRYIPFRSDLTARFTLSPASLSLDDFEWKVRHTEIEAHGVVQNFQPFQADFHYKGHVWLPDLRRILRKPEMPDGVVDFTGNGSYGPQKLRMAGHYLAQNLFLNYRWFHDQGIKSWGEIDVAKDHLTMPEFHAAALGGKLQGHLEMAFHGLAFRVQSEMTGDSLAQILAAVDNPELPVHTLHWDGSVSVDSLCTWTRDFKHLTAQGVSRWTPPAVASHGVLPVTAGIHFDYSMDRHSVSLASSTIRTPNSQILFHGRLGDRTSALAVNFHTGRIADWEDFISYLRGPETRFERVSGSADWTGNLSGPVTGPTFSGAFHVRNGHYGRLYWDDITGRLSYSPDEFQLTNARVKRGRSAANLNLHLGLDGSWGFAENGPWSLEAHLDRASSDDLQALFGTAYPASALITADFHGRGTRAQPVLDGNIHLQNIKAYGFHFERAAGELSLRHDQIRIRNAEVDKGPGRITGGLVYRPESRTVNFQIAGAGIPLEKVQFLQTKALPIGGNLDFSLHASGPIRAPQGAGSIRLQDLQFGSEVLNSFAGNFQSDGRTARLELESTKTAGMLEGHLEIGLAGNYPLSGQMTVNQIDLDPFIIMGLHLKNLTGHSSVDGQLSISGPLRRPDAIVMQANFSRVRFNYEYVKLENQGPVRLTYRRNEVHVEQATLSGVDTNFHISGDARFSGQRPLNLSIGGAINLRLATGLFPDLGARGLAEVEGTVSGTFSNPRITGQARIVDASAHYGDFPAGLSSVNGLVVFDRNRLLFDGMTAQAGGGNLTLSGSVDYGQGPLRYEVNAQAKSVRIRYPEGLSWLLGGQMRFSGTTKGALLSGNVVVQRLIFAQTVDLASFIMASQAAGTGPATTSSYLRNLQFDIEASTSPGMRIEWAGAHFSAEGSVHVRGTWDHPIVLGHIHLLTGAMTFHGNQYRLTRGDVDFSNPFRFDPVLNIEATTTINPYEITLDFTGPASRMQLSYRSDPPLPSSDVIALLALGTTGEQSAFMSSSSSQSQNFGATALLSEAISSQLGGPIEKLFGISHFRVDPFLVNAGAEQTTAARVTVEQQVTHNLSVTYSTNAASNQEQVIEIDYAIRRNISIVALRDINGIFGINVKFTRHFR